jgi:putative nucleotidyltransferase with HDIG domain
VSIIHVATDITERKRWERQLEESEAKFRELFDNMSSGVVVYEVKDGGRDFVIKAFNRAAERIERIKKEDVLGRAVTEVFPGVEKFGIFDAFRRVWQTGRPEFLPLGFYQDRRVTGWRENYVYKLPSGEIVAVYDDVTERKRTEESLQRSFDQLRRTLMSTINALTAAVEMRDPYTGGHQHRVPNLACAIARQMDLSEDQIAGLRVAGLVHDVGKINVPAEILSKPGKLSPAEYSLAQGHVQLSYEMLRQIEFPWPVAEIVLQHHERLDGSGYPRRLRGEEILPEARILGVADVVEAMSTHRPYRPAQGLDKALAEIKRGRGTLFDPLVVDACLGLFSQDGYRLEDEGAASVDSWSAFDIDKVLPRSSFL